MSAYLGLLPAKEEISWLILEEDAVGNIRVTRHKKTKIPEFGSLENEMAWAYTYVVETFQDITLERACVVHGSLSQSGSEAVLFRAQVEGVTLAALGAQKCDVVSAKKGRIASSFGLKKGAKLSGIPGLEGLREAHSLPKYMDEPLAAALMARS